MITADQWSPAGGLILEPGAQVAATSTQGNLLVTAGPGAGKTELLAQRADFLLRTDVCRYPRRILAISFKVDAAKNLKDRVQRRSMPAMAARIDSLTFHAFAKRIIDIFRPVLTGSDRLDPDYEVVAARAVPHRQIEFGQMAPLATTILTTSRIARTAVASTYAFVFLDEFQDCTPQQYALVRTAFGQTGAQLIAVGDSKQRIMGFAGADASIFERFTSDFDARAITLFQNRRSEPELRRMQNRMIQDLQPEAALPDDVIVGDAGEIAVQRYEDSREEARGVASTIAAWREQGVPGDEIAVLAAIQPHLYTVDLQEELRARRIPFRLENQLQDLATEPLATLITDFLCVVHDRNRPAAYARLMDAAQGWNALQVDADKRYIALRTLITQCRRDVRARPVSIADLVGRLREVTDDVLIGLSPAYQHGDRMEEVIGNVVEELEHLVEVTGNVLGALREFLGEGAVRILTVHKAKGLEFDAVVVMAVEHEMYFSQDAPLTFFVAVSRVRRSLVLTCCELRDRPAGWSGRWSSERTRYEPFLAYASA